MAISTRVLAGALVMFGASFNFAARAQTPVAIDGDRIYPESLDSGADGTLYIGSIGQGNVYRAKPGAAKATLWIAKSAGKISRITGVLTDEPHGRLWICSSDMLKTGEPVSLKAFDIKSGALEADYPFPESKGLCNDVAIGKDGTAYATDTPSARVFRLRPGATALEQWAADPRFTGIDGIAFGADGSLYVTNVRTGLLFHIAMQSDGSAGAITQVQTSRPLDGPDGFRPTGDGRFVIAENFGNKVSIGTFDGDKLQIDTVEQGFDNPPGVTVVANTIWVIESKSKYRNDPIFKAEEPGTFYVTPVPLAPKK
ncbi:MAG TPA: hypothetical protein VG271_10870 [Beijerinckiaceae bacterium]|nr:hypothetical protein [Beijerinckiaceae bacterium]